MTATKQTETAAVVIVKWRMDGTAKAMVLLTTKASVIKKFMGIAVMGLWMVMNNVMTGSP